MHEPALHPCFDLRTSMVAFIQTFRLNCVLNFLLTLKYFELFDGIICSQKAHVRKKRCLRSDVHHSLLKQCSTITLLE